MNCMMNMNLCRCMLFIIMGWNFINHLYDFQNLNVIHNIHFTKIRYTIVHIHIQLRVKIIKLNMCLFLPINYPWNINLTTKLLNNFWLCFIVIVLCADKRLSPNSDISGSIIGGIKDNEWSNSPYFLCQIYWFNKKVIIAGKYKK